MRSAFSVTLNRPVYAFKFDRFMEVSPAILEKVGNDFSNDDCHDWCHKDNYGVIHSGISIIVLWNFSQDWHAFVSCRDANLSKVSDHGGGAP